MGGEPYQEVALYGPTHRRWRQRNAKIIAGLTFPTPKASENHENGRSEKPDQVGHD
jgi:hypothetical protein